MRWSREVSTIGSVVDDNGTIANARPCKTDRVRWGLFGVWRRGGEGRLGLGGGEGSRRERLRVWLAAEQCNAVELRSAARPSSFTRDQSRIQ